MSQKGRTPDEKFLIQLHRATEESEDASVGIEMQEVGSFLGQKETAVKNIVKHLAQANFVKKLSGTAIVLTPHGRNFVLKELGF